MARKRRSPVKYTGPLSKPIDVPLKYDFSRGLLGALQAIPKDGAKRRARQQLKANLGLLFKHYQIDPRAQDRWYWLSICLASTHVPGMQVFYGAPPKVGAPRKWLEGRGNQLVNEVDAIRKATGKRIGEAIAILREDRAKDWHKHRAQSLETRYREAKRGRKAFPIWPGVWEAETGPGLLEFLLEATDEN